MYNVNKLLITFSTVLFICLFSLTVYAQPTQVLGIDDVEMFKGTEEIVPLTDSFIDYDKLCVEFIDLDDVPREICSDQQQFVYDGFAFELRWQLLNDDLRITAYNDTYNNTFTVNASSGAGWVNDTFNVEIKELPDLSIFNEKIALYLDMDEGEGSLAHDRLGEYDMIILNQSSWSSFGFINGATGEFATHFEPNEPLDTTQIEINQLSQILNHRETSRAISVWFYPTEQEFQGLFGDYRDGSIWHNLAQIRSNGNIHAMFRSVGTQFELQGGQYNVNEWNHFFLTVTDDDQNQTGQARLFLNGEQVDQTAVGTTNFPDNTRNMRFGASYANSCNDIGVTCDLFSGYLDEFVFWKRGFPASDIQQYYQAQLSGSELARYPFNEDEPDPDPDPNNDTPQQVASIPPLNQEWNEFESRSISDYFTNFDHACVSFTDSDDIPREICNEDGQTTYNGLAFDVHISNPFFNFIEFTSQKEDHNTSVTITAINQFGSTSDNFQWNINQILPFQRNVLEDIHLAYQENVVIDTDFYYDNYDQAWLEFQNPDDLNETVQVNISQDHDNNFFSVDHLSSGLIVILAKQQDLSTMDISLVAQNDNGNASQTVQLQISEDGVTPVDPDPIDQDTGLLLLINLVLGIFPDSEQLNTAQKLMTVGLFLFVTFLIGVYLIYTSGSYTGIGVMVLTGVLMFQILVFIGIGYIPFWMVLIIIILAVAFSVSWVRNLISGTGNNG